MSLAQDIVDRNRTADQHSHHRPGWFAATLGCRAAAIPADELRPRAERIDCLDHFLENLLMQLPPLTRDQVRRVDQIAIQDFEMPGIVLMENAGRGAAEVIDQLAPDGLITILCGSGNNAGDGYVIARHLQVMNRVVRIVSLIDPDSLRGDAAVNAKIAANANIEIIRTESVDAVQRSIMDATTVVDAILGTGARGAPRGMFADAVIAANDHPGLKIAIDLPTGLDCDTGVANDPTFRADHTLTFVSRKVGFEKENADAYVGVVKEIGIGVPRKLLQDVLTW